MPDSFAKTIPIWCAVVNRALYLRSDPALQGWDTGLYTPPKSVSKQEHAQIEAKMDDWAGALTVGGTMP